jgi:hypothetical protein
VVGVLEVSVRAVFPFSYLNFTGRGVSAAGKGMVNTAGFKEYNEIMFVR